MIHMFFPFCPVIWVLVICGLMSLWCLHYLGRYTQKETFWFSAPFGSLITIYTFMPLFSCPSNTSWSRLWRSTGEYSRRKRHNPFAEGIQGKKHTQADSSRGSVIHSMTLMCTNCHGVLSLKLPTVSRGDEGVWLIFIKSQYLRCFSLQYSWHTVLH